MNKICQTCKWYNPSSKDSFVGSCEKTKSNENLPKFSSSIAIAKGNKLTKGAKFILSVAYNFSCIQWEDCY